MYKFVLIKFTNELIDNLKKGEEINNYIEKRFIDEDMITKYEKAEKKKAEKAKKEKEKAEKAKKPKTEEAKLILKDNMEFNDFDNFNDNKDKKGILEKHMTNFNETELNNYIKLVKEIINLGDNITFYFDDYKSNNNVKNLLSSLKEDNIILDNDIINSIKDKIDIDENITNKLKSIIILYKYLPKKYQNFIKIDNQTGGKIDKIIENMVNEYNNKKVKKYKIVKKLN